MYVLLKRISFVSTKDSFDNGMIPINLQCKELFTYIHENNINYSFITGRKDYIRDITIENLKRVHLDKYIELYTCNNDYVNDISDFKEKCRENININYKIICTIGDQLSDLIGDYTGATFLIFNPFYKIM